MNAIKIGFLASIFTSQLVNQADVEPKLRASSNLTDLLKIQPIQQTPYAQFIQMEDGH